MKRTLAIAMAAVAIGLWIAFSSLYVVSEAEQALIVRLGRPIGVVLQPGLGVKLPWIDSVIRYDTRLLSLDAPAEQVILGDQKRLEVDTYTRFRIAEPLRYYQALRTVELGRSQLGQIVSSSVRRELGKVMLTALLSEERDRIVANIKSEVTEKARALGIEVTDVRLHRADLPAETSQAIYDRMKSERQREAKELRAQGFEWAQQIEARADRDRTVLLAEAQQHARILRGEGDAIAGKLFADAFGKDPKFFAFYRSLQTYRQALANAGPTLILSSDQQFLRYLDRGPRARDQD